MDVIELDVENDLNQCDKFGMKLKYVTFYYCISIFRRKNKNSFDFKDKNINNFKLK